MDFLKPYAAIITLALVGAILTGIWLYGHTQYTEGKAEVQAKWDADKEVRKVAADKQAAETLVKNKENHDALAKIQTDLRTATRDRDAALARLRNLPPVPGGGGLLMAGCGAETVPGVANHPGGTGLTVERRIGSCGNSSSDPCSVSRSFFEQSARAIEDRGFTRAWAAGQNIKTVGAE